MKGALSLVLLLCACGSLGINVDDWSAVDRVLEEAIKEGAFPGCVALVSTHKILYAKAFGNFTYGAVPPRNKVNPPMTLNTLFDMASCTKVTATTSAIAQFYQRGELDLETFVVDILGQEFGANGKAGIRVIHLLTHSAGFPPDPSPNYWDPKFGCPETQKTHPAENFSCQDRIYEGLMSQTLENPINSKYVYSDLSMITLMYVVGKLARDLHYVRESDLLPACAVHLDHPSSSQCFYEAYVRKFVFELLGMKSSGFLPSPQVWWNAAPTENDTVYLNRVIQGQVSDGNAYAMGGIAGHAGLFSNVFDLHTLMKHVMFAKDGDVFMNRTTAQFFTKEYNHTQSSRALGWNTNDPTVFDSGWGLECGNMSARTFMHTGYTGTELCGDQERNMFTILLTNRVYPSSANTKIQEVRRLFNTAVVNVFDSLKLGPHIQE